MGTNFPQSHHLQTTHLSLPRKQFLSYVLYALLPLALLHYLLFNPLAAPKPPLLAQPQAREAAPSQHRHAPVNALEEQLPPPPPAPGRGGEALGETQGGDVSASGSASPPCDYSDGEWVPDARPPLYDGTSCGTIKDGQNCMAHGRPDTGYLHWRWRPRRCDLPAFSPEAFLRWLRNRHLAFVGDSMARNQGESLLCLLASRSRPDLVYRDGQENRFRRWVFREHNATVSIFWSPLLTAFFGAFKEAVRRTLAEVARRHGADSKLVAVTTFSPAHFEGDWDKAGACPRRHPDPFAGGPDARVQNDCVHWCMPGPIDTFNEILLQTVAGARRLANGGSARRLDCRSNKTTSGGRSPS
ncbi:unnamed protein product [Triticum turgidum subsp. durum]|uniref:Trichome birefringence-like N-terminal domain-containing protein n=1 Tax=Triticum turgidum subsp. durum TaxID=4567 RepID=A0A9R1BKX3_TRITD|nr:unnamed protein product [Triticum turgidum subsp. durum]